MSNGKPRSPARETAVGNERDLVVEYVLASLYNVISTLGDLGYLETGARAVASMATA